MKRNVLLLLATVSLWAADFEADGKLWWAHVQFLADDKLEGRNTGSEGYRKAVTYVAGEFERFGQLPTETVNARGVAPLLAQKGQHGIQHFRRNRGGGVVIEINRR